MPPETLPDCDLCRYEGSDVLYPAVTECQLCGRDLCVLHSVHLRLLPGMDCVLCKEQNRCVVCLESARNRCTGCGAALCRLHTQELCGRISCAACLYRRARGEPRRS